MIYATQVIKDIEEALKREISALTTHYQTTATNTTVQTSFDPFTGNVKKSNIKANFYNENSAPNNVDYPRVDITFDMVAEDTTSGRMISIWEDRQTDQRILIEPNLNRPRVFEVVTSGRDGQISGSTITINRWAFNKVQAGYLIKIISGVNKATYKIESIDAINASITVDSELVSGIQAVSFNSSTRMLYILDPVDLFAVRAGDIFTDSIGGQFIVQHIDVIRRGLFLKGSGVPSLGLGSKIVRTGDVFKHIDEDEVHYIIMDPTKPKISRDGSFAYVTDRWLMDHPATPFNYHFTIQIKNKERPVHIAIADRMTETVINRPRRALDILVRNSNSVESEIMTTIQSGRVFKVKDANQYKVNDSVYLVNAYKVSDNNQIVDIDYSTNEITVRNPIPAEYNYQNETLLVANATLKVWSFFLNDDVLMMEDPEHNFYRQEYTFRIEGWKCEKSGTKDVGGITAIEGTIESTNNAKEDFKV